MLECSGMVSAKEPFASRKAGAQGHSDIWIELGEAERIRWRNVRLHGLRNGKAWSGHLQRAMTAYRCLSSINGRGISHVHGQAARKPSPPYDHPAQQAADTLSPVLAACLE